MSFLKSKLKRKKSFIKFNSNFENYFTNDLVLEELTKTIENGNKIFSKLIGEEDEEINVLVNDLLFLFSIFNSLIIYFIFIFRILKDFLKMKI
jgi:hypothetical protein